MKLENRTILSGHLTSRSTRSWRLKGVISYCDQVSHGFSVALE
jgi:hypothetical protein